MTQLSSTSLTLDDARYAQGVRVTSRGVVIDPQSTPLLHILLQRGTFQKETGTRHQVPLSSGVEALQNVAAGSDFSAPANEFNTALDFELADRGLPVKLNWNEYHDLSSKGSGKVEQTIKKGVKDLFIGLEALLFADGDGTSNTVAGIKKLLPLSDSGAVFNIPATRSNYTSDIHHNWATTAACGARTATLLGSGFVLTDFSDPDDGVFATLNAMTDDGVARGYYDYCAFCTPVFMKYLKRWFLKNNLVKAEYVEMGDMPKDYKLPGITMMKAGSTFLKYNDVLFIPAKKLDSAVYDVVAIPMKAEYGATSMVMYTVPAVTVDEKVRTVETFVNIYPWQRNQLGRDFRTPITIICQWVLFGFSGCICLKGDGTYDGNAS